MCYSTWVSTPTADPAAAVCGAEDASPYLTPGVYVSSVMVFQGTERSRSGREVSYGMRQLHTTGTHRPTTGSDAIVSKW